MNKPIRVLHVITGLGTGGAESFLINMFRNMDHSKIVFDFLLQSDENLYREELESYGSRFYRIPAYFRHPVQNRARLREILQQPFSAIHVHANGLFYITPIIYAKNVGIPCRIIHSHSCFIYHKIALPLHNLNRFRVKHYATHFFACSDKAGEWMFRQNYQIIPNAIDLDAFSFSPQKRKEYRELWKARDDTLVIGQVGRLTSPKNQMFTLDVFERIKQRNPNSLLVFVGDGELRSQIQQELATRDFRDSVLLLGARTDVPFILNAFDCFLFPSLSEGLGIVGIEAQANGIPMFCSEAIPKSAVIAKNCVQLSLSAGPNAWAEQILHAPKERIDSRQALVDAGFDIHSAAQLLQEIYLNACK